MNVKEDFIQEQLKNPDPYEILYPPVEKVSDKKIYRVGTFLNYFIDRNLSRVYNDYLMNTYTKNIYDQDTSLVHKRLQALGIDLLLIDPNLGTIDRKNIRDFHDRFEDTLSSLR